MASSLPWTNGPPSAAELENWLVATRNIERDRARQIAGMYAAQSARGWSEEALAEWIDSLVLPAAEEEDPDHMGRIAQMMVEEREATDAARDERNQALADQRSQVVQNQVQSYYDRAQLITDSGPGYDPNALANALALGDQVDPATGEPYGIDPSQVWAEIKGLSFNMGNLNLPFRQDRYGGLGSQAPRPRSLSDRSIRGTEGDVETEYQRKRSDQASAMRWSQNGGARFKGSERPDSTRITPTQALAMLGSMNEDQLTSLQQELFEAGLYGENMPSWGVADAATRQAFIAAFVEAAQRDPNKPISRILDDMANENIGRLPPPEDGPGAPGQQEIVEIPDFTPEVTSAETLSSLIDDTAQDLFGEYVSEDRKQALIEKLQQKEISLQRQEYDISTGNIREQAQARFALGGASAGGSGAPSGGADIDRFMTAISGLESGGSYTAQNPSGAYGRFQIMPSNWAPWATRAGLGPNAPRTPQNQDIVARRIMLDYYQQFGNWRDVAIAWFAGPGAVGRAGAENRSDGNMTVREYANNIMNRMGQLTQSDPMAQSGLVEVGGDVNAPIQRFDPASEAEAILKAQDPVGWEAHEFGDRAVEFYSLLQGVV